MLMEHFLRDDVGGKRNVCGMVGLKIVLTSWFLVLKNNNCN